MYAYTHMHVRHVDRVDNVFWLLEQMCRKLHDLIRDPRVFAFMKDAICWRLINTSLAQMRIAPLGKCFHGEQTLSADQQSGQVAER